MLEMSMREFLEAGVHFGHQTRKWNPKMAPYIFAERNNIHIIDLQQTVKCLERACDFILKEASLGKTVLFVGTKKQAQESIREEAERCGMPYVNQRWLGGMLTNFPVIKSRVEKLKRLEKERSEGAWQGLPKKEVAKLEKEYIKLKRYLSGIQEMGRRPDILFLIDPEYEEIAVLEANKLNIPVVGVVDTNCNPELIDYVIPANDDAIRACRLITSKASEAILLAKQGTDPIPHSTPPEPIQEEVSVA